MSLRGPQASGDTHPGLHRQVNEDRFHLDVRRGLFMVIDGVGGHLAGGKAADIALSTLREHLARTTGTTTDRVREAITAANNEIHRLAATRPEWHGMACVLTVAVLENGRAIVGHVGDTRLYTLEAGRVEKVTRDHSPVGELEDARRLTEDEAMHHPRRNEVYRDVGSDRHDRDDVDFIELSDVPFGRDAALLLCSDGLTDLVPLRLIADIVAAHAGQPITVVRALIDAANDAGGRDNVTVVYVEGERFAQQARHGLRPSTPALETPDEPDVITGRLSQPSPPLAGLLREPRPTHSTSSPLREPGPAPPASVGGPIWRPLITGALLVGLAALSVGNEPRTPMAPATATGSSQPAPLVVRPLESIMAAIERAAPGSTVTVEPGEYRERIRLKSDVRLVSRVPHAATIRLPAAASESEPAVTAVGIAGAELSGFRIVGDAATALGIGILLSNSSLTIVDVEIVGATKTAIDFGRSAAGPHGAAASLVGSHLHDNPGAALVLGAGAAPRISQNTFSRNGYAEHAGPSDVGAAFRRPVTTAFVIEPGATPQVRGNVFVGTSADAFAVLGDSTRAQVAAENWFVAQRTSVRLPTSARSATAGPPKPGEGGKADPTVGPGGRP
jgi:serine/threonine protein phosphatase PrpC